MRDIYSGGPAFDPPHDVEMAFLAEEWRRDMEPERSEGMKESGENGAGADDHPGTSAASDSGQPEAGQDLGSGGQDAGGSGGERSGLDADGGASRPVDGARAAGRREQGGGTKGGPTGEEGDGAERPEPAEPVDEGSPTAPAWWMNQPWTGPDRDYSSLLRGSGGAQIFGDDLRVHPPIVPLEGGGAFWDAVAATPGIDRADVRDVVSGLRDGELHLSGVWEGLTKDDWENGRAFAEAFGSHEGPLVVVQAVDGDNVPRELLRLEIEDGQLSASFREEDLDEAARMFVDAVTQIELINSREARANAVHDFLVRHNLRAVPGNYDGNGLYGLPATMNVTGYTRKVNGKVVENG